MVFVFHGDVFHLSRLCNDEKLLVEVYDVCESPAKILCEVVIRAFDKAFVKLYEHMEDALTDILRSEIKDRHITFENVDYVFEKNKWLLSLTSCNNKMIMQVDDENDTYDGQYLYHERLFENNKLIDIQHTFRTKSGCLEKESSYL